MKDYRVEVAIRNGKLLKAMYENGLYTAAELHRATGVNQTEIGKYLNLSQPALTQKGEWRAGILKISEALKRLPEDLFPKQHLDRALPVNRASFDADIQDIETYFLPPVDPESKMITDQTFRLFDEELDNINPRDALVIIHRFGLRGETPKSLKEIGPMVGGVTADRVRGLEQRGLEALRDRLQKINSESKVKEEDVMAALREIQQR